MPLYEYYCENCNTTFEQIRPFSEADVPIPCSHCFNKQVKRKLSKIAISSIDGASSGSTSTCAGCSSHNCSNCH